MDGFYTYFASNGFSYGSSWKNWNDLSRFAARSSLLFIPCVAPGFQQTYSSNIYKQKDPSKQKDTPKQKTTSKQKSTSKQTDPSKHEGPPTSSTGQNDSLNYRSRHEDTYSWSGANQQR